jgi:hypothetical protein
MPLSLMSWANLNHGLCGTDSDPVYTYLANLEIGKWYWFYAEFYLSLASFLLGYGVNYVVISGVHKVLNIGKHKKIE